MRYKLYSGQNITSNIPDGQHEVRALIDGLDVLFVLATSEGYIPLPEALYSLMLSKSPAAENEVVLTPSARDIPLNVAPANLPSEPQETLAAPLMTPEQQIRTITESKELPTHLREITSNDEIWQPEPDDFERELLGLQEEGRGKSLI